MRRTYTSEQLGTEIEAPAGYYLPQREETMEFRGRQLLYVLGSACIDSSCCGVSSWEYARVEGYLVGDSDSPPAGEYHGVVVDTVEDAQEKEEIVQRLQEMYPQVRVEFR